MDPNEVKIEVEDDFVIDRQPVPLAFCAHPTPKSPKIEENPKKDVIEEIFQLSQPVNVQNPENHRRPASLKSFGCDTESEFELSDEDSDFEETYAELQSGKHDSDEEFDKITRISAKLIEKTHRAEYPGENEPKKLRKRTGAPKTENVHEYDKLPPIELLSIRCDKNLVQFGVVIKVVDCMVVIESTSTEVLDFDSYLFDEKGNSIGQIYDIFGQVKTPQYAIRFNSAEEAQLIPIGMKVFYAPNAEEFSKMPFKGLNLAAANRESIRRLNNQLDQQEAISQAIQQTGTSDIPGIGSDVEFSDDEAEKEYRQKKNAVRRTNQATVPSQNRKRRNANNKVRFAEGILPKPQQAPPPAPKPYRRDFDAPPTSSESSSESRPAPATTSDNPYAEFGVHTNFTNRFGI